MMLLGSMQRKVMKDITLSDGTFVPKGVVIMSVALPMHRDSELYPDATTFDGFRFSDIRAETESEALKHQTVSLRPEYLLFGYGKHAWFVLNPHA
jgi:cytochrome P450